ncbi:lipoyltransferase [Panus rudis PR-1116 ss-1]|nr:lipoyltransferase [Panus rudis PR-1116 ss-1]
MSLPPVLYHFFPTPLPYARTLALQEQLHAIQLARRKTSSHQDYLLLLQHRPVYTTGRRQIATSPEVQAEEERLKRIGADFVTTQRGGQLTYHGPGQIVGYPLLDLGRNRPVIHSRDYICRMQKMLELHLLEEHGIETMRTEHTGVFLNPHSKVASIGVQVRHRLTSHGFSLNVTEEPKAWFDRVVACGLDDVRAGCIADATKKNPDTVTVDGEIPSLLERFSRLYERDVQRIDLNEDDEVGSLIRNLEMEARDAGAWLKAPLGQ